MSPSTIKTNSTTLIDFYILEKELKFLNAWKKGVKLIGHVFFKLPAEVNYYYNTESFINSVTSREQLHPNWRAIGIGLKAMQAHHQIFISMMYSFYNHKDGQRLLKAIGFPNFIDALRRLETEEKEIIEELARNDYGW